ncbi:pentapeptide repeat-containing protein, partial [Haemophilus parainfluenzae]|uniref:pentapeptide repeat-containing protein n=1 Tax=Haemophilus parainfluenzae TaxID=729 RepID=UPI00124AFEF3
RDGLIRNLAIWFSSWGGTKFTGADLTDASFSQAVLKSSHFYNSTLIRTQFHLAKKVKLARLGKTILANFQVQNLLIT